MDGLFHLHHPSLLSLPRRVCLPRQSEGDTFPRPPTTRLFFVVLPLHTSLPHTIPPSLHQPVREDGFGFSAPTPDHPSPERRPLPLRQPHPPTIADLETGDSDLQSQIQPITP